MMTSSRGRAVYRSGYSRDGVEYEITVFAATGGIYSTWQCSTCGLSGVNPSFKSSKDEAIDMATLGINKHHEKTHAARGTMLAQFPASVTVGA